MVYCKVLGICNCRNLCQLEANYAQGNAEGLCAGGQKPEELILSVWAGPHFFS